MEETEKKSKTPEDEALVRLESFWEAAMSDPSQEEWRTKIAVPCINYKEGLQYTEAELKELAIRKQPPTVNNQVKVTLDRVIGQYVKSKSRVHFKGRNDPDSKIGDGLSNLFRFIAQNNELEFEEQDMFDDGVTTGFGVLEVAIEYDEMYQPEILIQHEDALHVFYDPKSRRYNWNKDALFVGRWKWVDLEEAKQMFPDKAKELAQTFNSVANEGSVSGVDALQNFNIHVDKDRKLIRLIEIQYKTRKSEKIVVTRSRGVIPLAKIPADTLKKLRAAGEIVREDSRMADVINTGTFSGGILLENKETPRKFFSLVPFFVGRKKNGAPYSFIFHGLPLQDAINKRESKALHLLTVNQAVFEEGAVADETALAENISKPDGQVKLNPGHYEKFRLEKNVDLAVTQMNFHQSSIQDFRRVTGVNPDAMGEKSEIRSGVGISKKIAQTELIIAPVFNALRRTRVILAKNVLDLIQIYYTQEKIFQITDDLNQTKAIALTADNFEHIKQSRYDVVVDEVPDLATSREEQTAMLGDILPRVLPFGPFWARIMIKGSNIPQKDELLEELAKIPPPPLNPNVTMTAQIDALTPQEKIFWYQKLGAPPELIQQIVQASPPPANVLKHEADMAGNQSKAVSDQAKVQSEMVKAETEQQKAANEREKNAMDLEKSKMDLLMKKVDVEAHAAKTKIDMANTITKSQTAQILQQQKLDAAEQKKKEKRT
jgi:hypothetical protein